MWLVALLLQPELANLGYYKNSFEVKELNTYTVKILKRQPSRFSRLLARGETGTPLPWNNQT